MKIKLNVLERVRLEERIYSHLGVRVSLLNWCIDFLEQDNNPVTYKDLFEISEILKEYVEDEE